MNKIKVTYQELFDDTRKLILKLPLVQIHDIYAIPRGGVPVAMIISALTGIPLTDKITDKTLIVDDLIDSGKTLEQYRANEIAVLYSKSYSPKVDYSVKVLDGWIEFPYEETELDAESNVRRILEHIGEDPTREGLVETPKRYIKFLRQFLSKEEFNFTCFENESYDEMIIQKDIPFFSLCEHHIAPFFGYATVAYIPSDKIVGLSKLTRTVEHYANRLQNQERITSQIAERLQKELNPRGVAVTLSARHFCMEMRGVKTHDVHTTTTKLTGMFKEQAETRAEYMAIIK